MGHLPGERHHRGDVVAAGRRLDPRPLRSGGSLQDCHQLLRGRHGHMDLEEEPVELGLRQGVGALHLQRILGCHHQEWPRQRVGGPADGHRLLLHGLQQRRLRLGRGPVDLIGENEIGEHRPRPEPEVAAAVLGGLEHLRAHDVGGHEVGRELDPGEFDVHCVGQRAQQHRLAQTGDALEQGVPLAQQADEHAPHDVGLADYDLAHLGLDGRGHRRVAIRVHVSHLLARPSCSEAPESCSKAPESMFQGS